MKKIAIILSVIFWHCLVACGPSGSGQHVDDSNDGNKDTLKIDSMSIDSTTLVPDTVFQSP